MKKKLICINCPRGCNLETDTKSLSITGNFCPKGEEYAKNEITLPKRTVTSTILVNNGKDKLVSCKTSKPIDKDKIFLVMKEINSINISAPIKIGDILIKNILNTDVNIIATKNVEVK